MKPSLRRWKKRLVRVGALLLLSAILSLIFAEMDLVETFYDFSRDHEDWELDDIAVSVLAVILVFLGYLLYTSYLNYHRLEKVAQQRARLESEVARFRQSQSTGMMAAGLAHSANNFLQPIVTLARLLGKRLPPEDKEAQDYLDKILEAGGNASNLFSEISNISRQLESDRNHSDCDINDTVGNVISLAQLTMKSDINLTLNRSAQTCRVALGATDLTDVLMALINNARHASAESKDKRVIIETRVNPNDMSMEHGSVVINVTDYGAGIAENHLKEVFIPYFTTKPLGEGTGLGLAFAKRAVEGVDGKISLASEPNKGTCVTITLPCV